MGMETAPTMVNRYAFAFLSLALVWVAGTARAQAPAEYPPEIEKRAQALEKQVNAPCCWVPLDGHYSPVADEMKGIIRQKLAAGESERQILNAFEAQYTRRVLAAPPPEGFHWLLWTIPGTLLLAMAILVVLLLKKWMRRSELDPAPASAATPAVAATPQPTRTGSEDRLTDKEALDRVEQELSSL